MPRDFFCNTLNKFSAARPEAKGRDDPARERVNRGMFDARLAPCTQEKVRVIRLIASTSLRIGFFYLPRFPEYYHVANHHLHSCL
jgi:hypothetical protein